MALVLKEIGLGLGLGFGFFLCFFFSKLPPFSLCELCTIFIGKMLLEPQNWSLNFLFL